MRKFTLMSALMMLTVFAFAQQRVVLLEQFTQASCPPCATSNPFIEDYMADAENIVQISYQTSWPGTDPMNEHNPTQVQTRVDLYGIDGVPGSVLDGTLYTSMGFDGGWSASTIDDLSSVPPGVMIELTADVAEDFSSIDISASVEALEDIASSNLHIVVVEERIEFDSPPGSNGEEHFNFVMKQMLPTQNGTNIGALAEGESTTVDESWELSNVYDPTQLRVVAFVQEVSSKDVHQAAMAVPSFVVAFANNANVLDILEVPATVCEPTLSPSIKIRNDGNDDITSMDIEYSVNGGDVASYEWTGSISTFEQVTIALPSIDFDEASEYVLMAEITAINGGADESADNNILEAVVERAADALNSLTITINTDNYGSETYWEVRNASGSAIASGGNPLAADAAGSGTTPTGGYDSNATFEEFVVLPAAGCYSFYIVDAYGDGICCAYGQGSYSAVDQDGNTVFSGGEFAADNSDPFSGIAEDIECALQITELDASGAEGGNNGSASVSADGAIGELTISWSTGESSNSISGLAPGEYSVEVSDAAGCTDEQTFTVEAVCALSAEVEGMDDTNGNSTGSASVTVDGNFGSIDYNWDNGMTGASIDGLAAGTYTCVITDEEGCETSVTVTVENVETSLEDLEGSNFTQYPNPADNQLNIFFNTTIENGELTILNLSGQEISRQAIPASSSSMVLDTKGLENGNYIYQVYDKGELVGVKRMVVVH